MTTYSTSLKLALINDGGEVGLWGQTTNTNLGTLLEQAITGSTSINMGDANVTLTNLNGALDQARNQVLILTGTNSAVRDVIPPVVKKTYIVVNNTTGGYAIRVIGASGTGVNVPNGTTSLIYCNGTSFFEAINSNTITGNSSISGNLSVGGTSSLGGAITYGGVTLSNAVTGTGNMVLSASPTLTGTPIAPTAAPGTNNTQIATTAFVNAATSGLGTMAQQNANNVSITGGTISGLGTPLPVASGGSGRSTLTANNVILGNGTSAVNFVAPGSSGNLLVSNGSSWTSSTLASSGVKLGLGITGEVWNDLTGSRSFNSTYTNNNAYPIAVTARTTCSGGSAINFIVNGVSILHFNWQFNGCGSFGGGFVIVPPGQTYQLSSGQGLDYWRELY